MAINLRRAIRSINHAALVCGSLSAFALSGAAFAQEGTGQKVTDEIEEVQVLGIRRALEQALESKRYADSVIDSVNAEDIGKFPDKNIGDALQRIPGVTVERAYGEVNGVTIRGTAPEHSLVLLNGQPVASTGWFDLGGQTRSFNFELMSAEQVSGMDVYKSPQAKIDEGAIGGTVNLKTREPLDLDAFSFFGSVESVHSDLSGENDPAFSGLGSWKNDEETFGVLLAYSQEERTVTREQTETIGFFDGNMDDAGGNNYGPWGMGSKLFEEERERTSIQATMQFAPTDNMEFKLDYFNFELDSPHINHNFLAIPSINGEIDASTAVVNGDGATTYGEVTNTGGPTDLVPLFYNPVVRDAGMETDVLNLTFDYEGDGWLLSAVAGQSESKGGAVRTSTWWGPYGSPALANFSYDNSGPLEVIPTSPGYSPTNHSQQVLHQEANFREDKYSHEVDYLQADLTFDVDMGPINSIDVGVKLTSNEFSGTTLVMDPVLADVLAEGFTLDDFNGGVASGLHGEEGRAGTLDSYALIDGDAWMNYVQANATDAVVSLADTFSVEEDVMAAYVQANFKVDGLRGNVGLRLVDTSLTSKGYVDGSAESAKQDYVDFLPSVNLAYDLSEDVVLRFAAASVVSRPNYDDLRVGRSINVNLGTATVGSPDLDPYKANQYDLGVEWYFAERSVASATVFKKDISSYIFTTTAAETLNGCSGVGGTPCLVTRARNGGSGDVTGIELQFQQDFSNGFGVMFNYTYTDSELTQPDGQTQPLQGVSDNSYNATVYFENDYLSARMSYNYRDEWIGTGVSTNVVNDEYDQLDLSLVYHLNDQIDLSFEGVNILNETVVSTNSDFGVVMDANEYGARYYLGASFKF